MKILGPRVAIKITTEKKDQTESGLFVPGQLQDEIFPIDTAEVVAVGTGLYQNGINIPCEVKVGDKVVIPKGSPRVAWPGDDNIIVVGEHELVGLMD